MPRKNLIRSDFLPYHVTVRANNREAFALSLHQVWEVVTEELYLATLLYQIEIHAFVLMPNHFHLLLTTPREDLDKVMASFLSYITRTINLKSERTGRVFGARYHWSLIDSGYYYAHVFKYVYRNPVKAAISSTVEAYAFSTLGPMLGGAHLPFPLHYPRCGYGFSLIPGETVRLLEWLNRPFTKEVDRTIAKGIRKRVFKLARDRHTGKPPEWHLRLV